MKYISTVFLLAIILASSTVHLFAQYQNIRIDGPQSHLPEEVTIAINPLYTDTLAAAANIDHFYFSTNGGMNWGEKHMSSTLGVWGDPCVIFDSLGNLYYGHLSDPINGYFIDRIVVQKSTDNGNTWNDGKGIGLKTFPIEQDKEWLAVDFSQSPYKGNIYVSWTEFDQYGSSNPSDSSRIKFSKSTDQGETWTNAITISDKGGDCFDGDNTTEGAVPAVGPNGEIYISWAGPLGLMFDKSLDGGDTWGTDIFISDIPGGWAFDVPEILRCNGLPITMCDISNSPYRGNIYVCWGDQRNGTSNTDVFFCRSTDGGNTWTQPLKVNDDTSDRHQFFPWMTVDPTTGNIWAVFYDRRNTTGSATDVYVAKSTDGGDTFENFKVSETSFTPTALVFFGDYTNIVAWGRKVFPIWMRLDKSNQQLSIWTAPIEDTPVPVEFIPNAIPSAYKLMQNYPNPFNPSTTISYQIPTTEFVTVKVFDVIGNEITTLVKETKNAGVHEVNFDASNLSSGIFVYKIDAGMFHQAKKMLLLK